MRVRVQGASFDGSRVPIMVTLSVQDKINIANMAPDASHYAVFPEGWGTKEQMEKWMAAYGAPPRPIPDRVESTARPLKSGEGRGP